MSIKKNITLFFLIFFMSTFSFAGIMNEIRESQNQDNNSEQTQTNETEKTQGDNVVKQENNNNDSNNEISNQETSKNDSLYFKDAKVGYLSVLFIYLLLNFIIYNYVPNLRFLAIAPPNEFAAKIKRNESQEKTKHEKFKRLNHALIAFIVVYSIIPIFLILFQLRAYVAFLIFFAIVAHLVYLFWRRSEKCPSCKSEDSMKEIRSKKHSLGTFTKAEKREIWRGHTDGGGNKIKTETYVDVTYKKIQRDYTMKCVICNEEFDYTEKYDEEI